LGRKKRNQTKKSCGDATGILNEKTEHATQIEIHPSLISLISLS
jgi:hypothetical protein